MAYGVIYLLIDGTNDKEYVGQTTRSVEERFKEHVRKNYYIGNAIRAHGENMFTIAIIKECENKEELNLWEKHFIRSRDTKYPNGYNLTDGGDCCWKHTDETCAKISLKKMGKNNSFFGKKHSDKTKAIISSKNTGQHRTDLTRARMSKARKGVKKSIEHCAKISSGKRKKSFYKNLLSELDEHKMSYHSLATLMDLSYVTISDKMRGVYNFTERDRDKLEEIFGKPIEYLLARDDL